jgi:hypothetical protein
MGYYYFFDGTGEKPIDDVLEAVESAGKSFHHTQDWTEKKYDGTTCVEDINAAAKAAAAEVAALRAEVERLKSPAVVLTEAERLLREADVCNAWFESDGVALSWWVESDDEEAYDSDTSLTLAEAYASLKEAGDGRG